MKCEYYNCNKEIPDTKRKGTKFCCRECKTNNRKMKTYWNNRKEEGIKEQLEIVNNYKKLMKIIQREE